MNIGAVMSGRVINNLRFMDDRAATTEDQLLAGNIESESLQMAMLVSIDKDTACGIDGT